MNNSSLTIAIFEANGSNTLYIKMATAINRLEYIEGKKGMGNS